MITSRLISKEDPGHHAGKYLAAFLKQADKPLRAVGHDVNHCSLLQHVIFLANRRLIFNHFERFKSVKWIAK